MRTLQSLRHMTFYQFRSLFRNRVAIFFNLVLPLIFVAVFGSMYAKPDSVTKVPIGVVDLDHGAVADSLHKALDVAYNIVKKDQENLMTQLSKGEIQAVVILPEGLSNRTAAQGHPAVIRIVYDPSVQASEMTRAAIQQMVRGVDSSLQGAAPILTTEPQPLADMSRYNVFDFLMPGQMTYMLLSAGLMSVAMALAHQRQSGTLRHMFSTPLSIGVWMAARIAANLLMTILQFLVLFQAARLMFHVSLPTDLVGTAVVLGFSALATLGMGLAVGCMAKSPEAAMPVAMMLYMVLIFLGNAMMPMDNAPAIVQNLSKVMPSNYMTHALRVVMMQGKGLGAALPDLAVLGGCAVVLIGLAGWRMRKQFTAA